MGPTSAAAQGLQGQYPETETPKYSARVLQADYRERQAVVLEQTEPQIKAMLQVQPVLEVHLEVRRASEVVQLSVVQLLLLAVQIPVV
jgi:hypothetical protein